MQTFTAPSRTGEQKQKWEWWDVGTSNSQQGTCEMRGSINSLQGTTKAVTQLSQG